MIDATAAHYEDEEDNESSSTSPQAASRRSRNIAPDDARSLFPGSLWLTLSVPLVACEFAGNQQPWALALVAALVGLNLVLNTPRSRVTRTIVWPLVFIALLISASLLPAGASLLPKWRAQLRGDFGITLPFFLSPQPWVTLEQCIYFIMGSAWLLSCLGRRFDENERRWLTRGLTVGMALIAAQSLLFSRFGISPGFWRHESPSGYSGPFSTPDVFGGFLAMGSLLGIAVMHDTPNRKKYWLLPRALFLVPLFWATLLNSPRTGALLFFGGMAVWIGFTTYSKRFAQRMSLFLALLLILASLFVLFNDSILEALSIPKPCGVSLSGQARLKLAENTFDLVTEVPMLGVGLGNFEPVFALSSHGSDLYIRPAHPGNDWLWLGAEAGVPVVVLLFLIVVAFIFSSGSWRSQSSHRRKRHRLRIACVVAALMVPVHGLFDVPGHHIGLLFTMMLLAGLSLPDVRKNSPAPHPARPGLRWIAATFLFCIAALWLAVGLGHPLLPGGICAGMLEQKCAAQDERGELENATNSLNSAIAMKPLQWNLYFDRAALCLVMGHAPGLALEDFSRARALESHSSLLCYQEALLWMRYRPLYSIPAWRQALGRDHSRASQFFVTLCQSLQTTPELRASVRDLAADPKLKLVYLTYATPDEFSPVLQELLLQQPSLNSFTTEERLQLFRLWYERGDRSALLDSLERDSIWRSAGWQVLAAGRAATGDYKRACQVIMEMLPQPSEEIAQRTGSLDQLRRAFLLHPTDYSYGLDLYEAEKAKNLIDDALQTLEKVSQIPGVPRKLLYDQAVMLIRKDDHAKAWDKLRTYLELQEFSQRSSNILAGPAPIPVLPPRSKHLPAIRL